jgi:hypothetical protein
MLLAVSTVSLLGLGERLWIPVAVSIFTIANAMAIVKTAAVKALSAQSEGIEASHAQ